MKKLKLHKKKEKEEDDSEEIDYQMYDESDSK